MTPRDELLDRIARLVAAIKDIDAHATPMGDDGNGFVDPEGGYLVSVGSIHRALGVVASVESELVPVSDLWDYRVLEKDGTESAGWTGGADDAEDGVEQLDKDFPEYAPHRLERRVPAGPWVGLSLREGEPSDD